MDLTFMDGDKEITFKKNKYFMTSVIMEDSKGNHMKVDLDETDKRELIEYLQTH